MTLYFAYGSNLWHTQMAERCPAASPLGRATLDGYDVMIMGRGYATIVPREGWTAHGGLWRLSDNCVDSLDRWEGTDGGSYVHDTTEVERLDGSRVEVMTYVATDDSAGRPTPEYATRILDGAQDFDLPDHWVAHLNDVLTRHVPS